MSSKRLATNNNQLPEGYKKTDIGVIPEDWEYQAIGEAFEIRNNLRLPISKEKRQYIQGKYPYYGPTNVQDYIDEYRVEGEHALIGEDGDHFLKWRDLSMTLLVDGKFNVNNHAHIIKGVKNLTAWFYYFFAHRDLTQYLKRQGAGRYKLDKNTLINIPCAIPPLREQKAIAQTLSDVDALIAALDKHIAKKRNIKTGTMQQLLTGKTRLPGLGGSWKTMLFLEIAWCRKERIDPRKSGTQEFCVELEHIESGTGRLLGNTQTGDQSSLKAVFQPGDVLFGKLRSYLQKYWIADREGVCSTEIWVLAANARLVISKFLYQVVTTEQFINAASNAYGTHMPRSDWNIVKNYKVAVPPLPEQKAIAKVLFDIDTEITALEKRRAKTQAIKQGMMQELLTGRTRLKIEHPDDPITKNSNG